MSDINNTAPTSPTCNRRYEIATDGACSGNPGPGGWGARLLSWEGSVLRRQPKELSGWQEATTNNEMELVAAIRALRFLKNRTIPVTVKSDSQYLIKGMTEWREGWLARGWRTASGKPVKNGELWLELCELVEHRDVTWTWVKGHSGDPENERADALAKRALARFLRGER